MEIARSASASATRPNDTTAYAAGDVVGGLLQFSGLGMPGLPVLIQSASLEVDAAALIASEANYTLHLFNAAPTAILDNAAFDLKVADRAAYLGSILLGTPAAFTSTLWIGVDNVGKLIKMGASRDLWGYLTTAGAYTPTALRVFRVLLGSRQLG